MNIMQKEVEAEFMELLHQVQFQTIKQHLTTHYIGGKKAINRWDDFMFSLCDFFADKITALNPAYSHRMAHRRLDKLAETGVITRTKLCASHSIRYRMNREICDHLAGIALAELRAEGIPDE